MGRHTLLWYSHETCLREKKNMWNSKKSFQCWLKTNFTLRGTHTHTFSHNLFIAVWMWLALNYSIFSLLFCVTIIIITITNAIPCVSDAMVLAPNKQTNNMQMWLFFCNLLYSSPTLSNCFCRPLSSFKFIAHGFVWRSGG